jgi:hypothetical protein
VFIPSGKACLLDADASWNSLTAIGGRMILGDATPRTLTVATAISANNGGNSFITVANGQTLTINADLNPYEGSRTKQIIHVEAGGTLNSNGDWLYGYCVLNNSGAVVHVGDITCNLYQDVDLYEQDGTATLTHTGDMTSDLEGHMLRIHGGTATINGDSTVMHGHGVGVDGDGTVTFNGDIYLDEGSSETESPNQPIAYAYGIGSDIPAGTPSITHNGDIIFLSRGGFAERQEAGTCTITHNGRIIWDTEEATPARYSRRTLPISVGVGQALVVGA